MKKAARINILVITIVITLFVFVGLWYVRPGVSLDILEQAKERQTLPLMEVTPPVKKPAVEEVPQTEVLVKELLSPLQEALEAPLTASVRSNLLADETLMDALSEQLEPRLIASLHPQMEEALASEQKTILALLESKVAVELQKLAVAQTSLEVEIQTQLATVQDTLSATLREDFQRQVDEAKESLSTTMKAYVPQLVDQAVDEVVQIVYAKLEEDKEQYIQSLLPLVPEGLTEADILGMYDTYRSQLVKDLVPSLLDAMEDPVRSRIDAYVDSLSLVPVPAVPAIPTPTVTVAEQVVVEQELPVPVPQEEPVVVVEEEPEPVEMEVPVIKQGQEVIAIPVFEEKETVVFLEPEVYEQQRDAIRTKAIEDVLKRIAPLE